MRQQKAEFNQCAREHLNPSRAVNMCLLKPNDAEATPVGKTSIAMFRTCHRPGRNHECFSQVVVTTGQCVEKVMEFAHRRTRTFVPAPGSWLRTVTPSAVENSIIQALVCRVRSPPEAGVSKTGARIPQAVKLSPIER